MVETIRDFRLASRPSAVALGNFDGVHKGHEAVLRQVLDDPNPTVLTFEPHPREYFSNKTGFLLTPDQEKFDCLARLGFAQTVVLPFNFALAQLTASVFVSQILVAGLGATAVSIGPDFCFGYQRQGNATVLRELGQVYGFDVRVCEESQWTQRRISSSAIREALGQGDCGTAWNLLGRPYALVGTVVTGEQRGRQLGFPTANLALSESKFIPRTGVYRVRVIWRGQYLPGVLNIGYRPTFAGEKCTLEVHLLDWQGDLYGEILQVELLNYVRPEQKFASLQELQAQIQQDVRLARQQS
jgi:riboflavin kinase / FMN adenylyltransferase